ncbi:non-ribosomal peptide synthetase [Brasilonema bromeliae]|uniref:Non-ribosomal peptide synthetase n=1 Tax=Brasilonema bromeliae SPC951 TaxID=385972 RepID=A0ABX1P765_9CYAN|nr:non-ribosomal peptide synthetase [Brasilonema bromeliae]NMG19781.1 non-ribosomal peptide synthetase [Brasilonema bromeliae SPC951]
MSKLIIDQDSYLQPATGLNDLTEAEDYLIQTDYPRNLCIHQMFEAQVQQTPNAVAVVFENQQLTYRQLNQRANQLAHYLRTLGVAPEVMVGICMERSLDMVVGLLGILKAGGAYVPIDPKYPQERLHFMLSDTQVSVLLTTKQLANELFEQESRVVCLDTDWESIAKESQENPLSELTQEHLAYVMYTSGSTGKPKGVQITHANVAHYIPAVSQVLQVQPEDVYLHVASFSFSSSVRQLMVPLYRGATSIIATGEQTKNPISLFELIQKQGVTICDGVPSIWRYGLQGLETLDKRHTEALQKSKLRTIVLSGDLPPVQLYKQLRDLFQDRVSIFNVYGQTETIGNCAYLVPKDFDPELGYIYIPVGYPYAHNQTYILDEHLQAVAPGEVGELYIGGACLARGYLNHPKLNAEKFISNPFSQDRKQRLFQTGDLARYWSDGSIELLGRTDFQVKIRGMRVELGEIESILVQHPTVKEAVVIATEDVPGEKRLVAYVVPNLSLSEIIQNVFIKELRGLSYQKLADYMVPSAFVLLDSLPLTPNGKIDRLALPVSKVVSPELEVAYVKPQTETEEIIATVWQEVLQVEKVGIHDNFFELGGHSLLATQIISRCRQAFGVEISLQSLFETPTIAELASAITTSQNQGTQEHQIISRQTNRQSIPLSFAQARLWFLAQLEPDSAAYNVVDAMQLQGNLNVDVLQQSLDAIATHHEVLRTNFIVEDGNPVQVIREPQSVELKLISLMDCPETERTTVVQKLLQQEAQRPFNLSSDLMLRACLLEISPQEHILQLTIHHIATDGWSMSILFEQLTTLYQAFLEGKPNPLPQLPIQYADYAVWQRQWLSGEVVENQLNYWKQQLAGAIPVLELPTDKPRPPVQTRRGAKQSFVLPKNLSASLSALSRQEGVTLFMTLLAAFQTLLYRYSGQQDILVGSPTAGRNREEIEGLIGFFVNTLVLRTDLSGNPSFRELLQRVRSHAMSAYANQDLPFDKLVEELQPERSLSYHPLFQVMFVLQNVPTQTLKLPGLSISTIEVDNFASQFDITLSIEETEQGLRGLWEYSTDLFDADTITRMSGHFQTLLEEVTANPQQHVNELPLLSATERQQLLEWNDTQAEYQEQCIHELFEVQVEKTPHAVAVMFEGEQLTYQQLNTRANQLAHYLKTLGVGADVLVGICMERSLEMVVGLLGILKAGGAYVPIDPAYPKERLTFILEDTQTPVMLTQEKLVNSLQNLGSQVICLDSDWELIANNSQENPVCEATVDDLMYVIYTSGSTGKPKGVMVPHRGISNQLHWRQATFQLTEQDKVLQTISLSFDPSVWQIFWPLLFGGQLIMARPDGHRDPAYMVKMIIEQQITVAALVPSIIRVLLEEKGIENCTSLKHVTSGGEALAVELIERFVERLKLENVLINCYGPTEASIDTTFWTCQRGTDYTIAPIGRAIANVQVYILDDNLQPVPVGQSGELYIGGTGLARGYLNRPELTAQKFIRNPFSSEPGARLYKTGDLARYLSNGNIEFLNRIDYQVKIRGFRIELGEIEAILGEYPGVQQTLVSVREDVPGDKRLVAYIVAKQVPPSASELRDFLQGKLPEYMVPKAFVFLDVMPLNPNGKVDRRALKAPEPADFSDANSFVAPRTPTEEVLATIWTQVLSLDQVGIYDNFFELGGHSLLATQVISRVCQTLGSEIPLQLLFETRTIAGLAQAIVQSQADKRDDDEISRLLNELEELSDEQAESLLAQLMQQPD